MGSKGLAHLQKKPRVGIRRDLLAYILPIAPDRRILWSPPPQFVWGELLGLTDELIVLSPDLDIDLERIPSLMHDQVFRPTMRRALATKWFRTSSRYMMLWGAIWLIGMDRPLEDIVAGLYLLIGQPFFSMLRERMFKSHLQRVLARFKTLFYQPTVRIVYSERLARLEKRVNGGGSIAALAVLDELGLGHLREIYKRSAWSEEWTCPPPTGQGVLNA
jgi:hypothetical protein